MQNLRLKKKCGKRNNNNNNGDRTGSSRGKDNNVCSPNKWGGYKWEWQQRQESTEKNTYKHSPNSVYFDLSVSVSWTKGKYTLV